ncbi:ferric reductase-like transmembrane domain-containing protein [Bacillus daqingensis]|uniref:Ferric oxidoreductase domain-containing protein n=2 Tax=Bacillaceae TaxID=186817 RepID=A0A969PQ28_9BACI|nr:ferric reductase-like transmembrane domain-containing protein [Alkalicoccus luteus]NJP37470.1 hypothetical protein [Alkalicoccus luteus]
MGRPLHRKKELIFRHIVSGTASLLLVYLFYLSYTSWGVELALWPDWGADHPFWRAWAHAAFILLFITLILSPIAVLWPPAARFLSWRREIGIWFAILSAGHGYAILDRWAQWDLAVLFGFQYVEEIGSYVLMRPEVGIMNIMGLIVAPMIILLAATSFDKSIQLLGVSTWKWLHRTLVHVIFYIVMLRGILYLFYFFQTTPPDWIPYPPIWFLYVFLGMGLTVVVLQAAAFTKKTLQNRNHQQQKSWVQIGFVLGVSFLYILPMLLLLVAVIYFDTIALEIL